MQILQSELVRVRRARWRVADVAAYERCQLLTLHGVDAINARVERLVLSPFDDVERAGRRTRPRRVSRQLWRRVCRALVATDTPPGGLLAARRARIDLLPHQLEPALALVHGKGSRILLADAVGLGKTIQAGLIVAELRARGAADRVLVLTPAGLRDQWAHELADRFDLAGAVIDARTVRQAVATLPVGVNPWQITPTAIASIDYIKRPDILASLAAGRWDVLVVDEAHGVVGDSDRHAAIAALARRTPFVVLLTATPHSGDPRAFRSLCGLGSSLDRDSAPDPGLTDQLLVFQRTRADVRVSADRRIHRLFIRPSAAETRMHDRLGQFARLVERELGAGHESRPDAADPESATAGVWLSLSVLHKRALSSASSLLRSVQRRLAALTSTGQPDGDQLQLPFLDPAGELTPGDLPPPWPSALALRDAESEQRILGELAESAAAASRHETKIHALGRLLRRAGEPAIVFTEYRDTLVHLEASLGVDAAVLHGGLTREERRAAIGEFTSGARSLLLATDAAAEGLNLHHVCRTVVNLELPWNPMRLEQRIGRVDRIGQTRTVHAFHLIARDTAESAILGRLEARLDRARLDIAVPDPLGMNGHNEEGGDVRLKADATSAGLARSEAERIGRARMLARRGDEDALVRVEGRGPCLITARRPKTRAALGRRLLLVYRTGMAANASRTEVTPAAAGSLLVPLAIDLAGMTNAADPPADVIESLLGRLGADIRQRIDLRAAAWRQQTSEVHGAFVAARLIRERAIGRLDAESPVIFQPGLFDRRTERVRQAVLAAAADRRRDRAAVMARLEQGAALSPTDPELLLVLIPA